MNETGGEFSVDNDDASRSEMADVASGGEDGGRGARIVASAEMYVHSKNPEQIQSEWLRYVLDA